MDKWIQSKFPSQALNRIKYKLTKQHQSSEKVKNFESNSCGLGFDADTWGRTVFGAGNSKRGISDT
jgi:hypothetical protein